MTCREAIAILGDYLEASLGPAALAELETHLRGCDPCAAYLATYRRARDEAAAAQRTDPQAEMPDEMKRRLRAFLLARLREASGP